MKYLMIICAAFVISMTACTQKKESTSMEDGTQVYACPMKCEGDKVYAEPGKCPVCGMDLMPVKDVGESPMYEMSFTTVPETPEPGKATKLIFEPRRKDNDSIQVPLDEVHEKKIHVILVSKDLAWYDHIHPDYQPDGTYTVDEVFPFGGEFIVFADYQPTGAGNQVERKTVVVNGMLKTPESFTKEILSTQTDGYTVTLKPSQGKILTNNMIHMGVEVTDKGKPVTDFENIMGAKGHLVIISGDGQKYLHVHPDEVDGALDLHTQFDQPGIYRAFFQFQTNGKLHTSYFTLDVKEGKPGELGTDDGHDHEHQHESGEEHEHSHEN